MYLTVEQKKEKQPQLSCFRRVYSLPKIHKQFDIITSFRLNVDTAKLPHHRIGQQIAELLKPLTKNKYLVQDFKAVSNTDKILIYTMRFS